MAGKTRTTIALVAVAVIAPLNLGAQDWTSQNINGLNVWDRDGQGWHTRAVQMQYGWYMETSYFDSNRRTYGMMFEVPAFQQANRIDYVGDTNGDGVFDTGYQWIVGRGWQAWTLSDLAPVKTTRDQAYSQYLAAQGGQQQEVLRLFYVRADKFYQTLSQMLLRGHNP